MIAWWWLIPAFLVGANIGILLLAIVSPGRSNDD